MACKIAIKIQTLMCFVEQHFCFIVGLDVLREKEREWKKLQEKDEQAVIKIPVDKHVSTI